MKILLAAMLALVIQVAGADTTKGPFIQAAPVIKAVAKMANTGLIDIKQINKFEKILVSEQDRKFLKSISYKPLLPKGYVAIPMMDRMMIVKDKHMVSSLQIVSFKPLTLKFADGKSWTIDPKDVLGSLKVGRLESSSAYMLGQVQEMLFPSAYAVQSEDYMQRSLAFITYLLSSGLDLNNGNDLGNYQNSSEEIRQAMLALYIDGNVRCAGGKADLTIQNGQLKTHVTSDGVNKELYCSKEDPDHKVLPFWSNEEDASNYANQLDENCLTSDRPETIATMNQQRQNLINQINIDFAFASKIDKVPGTVEINKGACSIKFVEKPPFKTATLAKMTSDVAKFCENYSEATKVNELDARIADRSDFIKAIQDNSRGINQISKLLASCCKDNNCRLKALNLGALTLEHPDAESTK